MATSEDTTPARAITIHLQTESPDHDLLSGSPNLAATPVSSCFSGDMRSFSGMSTLSSQSSYSNISAASKAQSGTTSVSRRRGYVRPQGGSFAPSAQNRESVMSLGSIAHLQYYFARTGLLDGKGGHLAREKKTGEYDIPRKSERSISDSFASPIEEEGELLWELAQEEGEEIMLPPTVSTYSHRSQYVPPPPDQQTLKKELVECLENSLHSLEHCEKAMAGESSPSQGFYELLGLDILDKTTLAIRAARVYYTSHPNPKRLNEIKSDQKIRKDLYDVLEVLKRGAARKFLGGLREDERLAILIWVSEIGMMIDEENKMEEADKREQQSWRWLQRSNWIDNPAGRDVNFIDFLLGEADVPASENYSTLSSQFIRTLADGKILIRMHNAAVRTSKKKFGQIETWHEDTGKPYRRADNIRYWLKASELRFEHKLTMDVLQTVSAPLQSELWAPFEQTVLEWARVVREELTKDWDGEEEKKLHARARSLAMASPIGSPESSPGKRLEKKAKKISPLAVSEEEIEPTPTPSPVAENELQNDNVLMQEHPFRLTILDSHVDHSTAI